MREIIIIYFLFITLVLGYLVVNFNSNSKTTLNNTYNFTNIYSKTTPEQAEQIKYNLEYICKVNHNPCVVSVEVFDKVTAYTTAYGGIVLTRGLQRTFEPEEVFAIGLHEVGHHLLRHYKLDEDFRKSWDGKNQIELQQHRHKSELQADMFATAYYILLNKPNPLPRALIKITAKDKLNEDSPTHPSTNKRIRYMKEFEHERLRTSL